MKASTDQRPIGVFDSGLGGLTILKAIMEALPHESTVYFGDSGRMPYGNKSEETVRRFSIQNTRFLLDQDVKMVVIACNTASSQAVEAIRAFCPVPVVEVIEPACVAAIRTSKGGGIGVIGTRGTVESGVYQTTLARLAPNPLTVVQQACPLFVGLVEEGWWDHPVTREVARIYLEPVLAQGTDTLILGCTHYPFLSQVIAETAGSAVELIQSGPPVAGEVARTLRQHKLLAPPGAAAAHRFYTSDSVALFERLGTLFLDRPICKAQRIDIEGYAP